MGHLSNLAGAKAMLGELGVAFPDPWLGEPFIRAEVSEEVDTSVVWYGPPCRPCREVYEWDEIADTDVYVRTMSAEEFAGELRQYEQARKEWAKDGGQKIVVNGPSKITGTFQTVSGSRCEGIWDGSAWVWTAWQVGGTA